MITASPVKLNDGTWGARVTGPKPTTGTVLTVKAKNGNSWECTVNAVVWSGSNVHLVATQATKAAKHASKVKASRVSFAHWECRACGEENRSNASSCWECGCGR